MSRKKAFYTQSIRLYLKINNGKIKRKEFTGKTQQEVKKKLEEYKKEMLLGTISSDDKITVSEWYYTWLFDYRVKDLKPKSFEKEC